MYSWKKEIYKASPYLDHNKSEYFLDFIFSGGMQEDAYGVTKIKHDSGEEQIVYAILLLN